MAGAAVSSNDGVRIGWIDAAKGGAIILVVLFHATIFLDDIWLAGPWNKSRGILDTVLMQMFFFASGLFARKVLSQPLGIVLRTRVMNLLWLYAVWSLIWEVFFQFVPLHRAEGGPMGTPWGRWVRSFFLLNQSMWFTYALALYFLIAWCIKRLPVWLQVGSAAVVSSVVSSSLIMWRNLALEKVCMYFVFFLLALHFGPVWRPLIARVKVWQTVLLLGLHIGVFVIITNTIGVGIPGIRFALGLSGGLAGICVCATLARVSWMRWLEALGRHTLEIYLAHFFIVLATVAILAATPPEVVERVPVAAWVPILTVLGVAGSLGFHWMTRSLPGLWKLPFQAQQS